MTIGSQQETGGHGPKVLFLSRAFPPVIGGIENQNYALSQALQGVCGVETIANRRGKRALPFFLPWVLLRAVIVARRFDVILLGDGVMAVVGWAVKRVHRALPVACVVHGLDLTHPARIYQRLWVERFLPSLDHLIAVSRSTRDIALQKGIPPDKVVCIPNGISAVVSGTRYTRQDLERMIGSPLGDAPVLVTVGRLVRRKGVAWFIENVMPLLPPETRYLVAGTGPEQDAVAKVAAKLSAGNGVRLLGAVTDEEKAILLNAADLFIQPNIPVEGDVEGFGITLLEAGTHGLPVVAADLEGLKDSVQEGKNGWLVQPGHARVFAETIIRSLADRPALRRFGEEARLYVNETFSWQVVVYEYKKLLAKAAHDGSP